MSLRVWLPLTGSLENKGLSNFNITSIESSPTYTDGKIGKCYQRANTNSQITNGLKIDNNLVDLLGSAASVAVWVKPLGTHTHYNGTILSSGNWNAQKWAFGVSQDNSKVDVLCGSYNNYITCAVPVNEWTHLVSTFDNGTCKLYKNGIYVGQLTGQVAFVSDATWTGIGRESYASGYFGFNGCINDLRIYDHCLSAAEVKEIAQGLVLHYKLDSMKVKTGTNLVTGVTKGGHTTVLTDGRIGVQTTGENADTYFTINLSESITNGTKYFLSCDACGISEGAFWGFPLGAQNNSSLPFKIYNGHNEYLFTANDINWGSNRLFLDDINRSDWANKATFWNFELYKVPTLEIEDNSGYGHNATLTNGLLTTNVSRYSTALNLDASTKAIGNPIFEAGTFIPEYTWTGWINRNYTSATSKQIHANIANVGLYTDFTPYFSWTSGKTDGTTTGNGAAGGTAIAKLNEWTHMAITYKDGIGKFYINGELIKTFNYSSYGVYIAAAANNTLGNGFIGNLSDIRIYVTQLLDKDIKLLYNSSMRLDNLGNCHTYELNENKVNLMWRPENARAAGKGFNNGEGLSAYTQPNCQVTCNSDGYKIYRPANLTVADNGNTMYGGLKIRNSTNGGVHIYDATIDNIFNLQKGHTYIWIFTVNGSTENASGFQLTNNMGWSGGGLNPTPSNVTSRGTGSNFNGTQECWYKFTINDDIVKTCTSSYSAFVQGNQYLSYMDFGFYFSYQSTGTGTNLYISNIRLYDITNIQQKLNKTGIANFTSFIEENYNNKILSDGEFYGQEFIEI